MKIDPMHVHWCQHMLGFFESLDTQIVFYKHVNGPKNYDDVRAMLEDLNKAEGSDDEALIAVLQKHFKTDIKRVASNASGKGGIFISFNSGQTFFVAEVNNGQTQRTPE